MRHHWLRVALVTALTVGLQGPALGQSKPKEVAAKAPRCPIVAMELVSVPTGQERGLASGQRASLISVDGNGRIVIPLMAMGSGAGGQESRLDSRGCLVGPGGVWVDQTARGVLWTLRQEMTTRTCAIQVGPSRWLEIGEDGNVTSPEEREAKTPPTMRFLGYKPEACCAARLLLAAFLSMMPSMAVSDGNPVALEPPKDSACPELKKLR